MNYWHMQQHERMSKLCFMKEHKQRIHTYIHILLFVRTSKTDNLSYIVEARTFFAWGWNENGATDEKGTQENFPGWWKCSVF